MNFDLKRPCPKCPFRTDCMEGWFGWDRAEEIADDLYGRDLSFACHETTEHDDDGEHVSSSREQHCAGAAIWLMHQDQPNQLMRIAERLGAFDPAALDMDAPVFDDWFEFVGHHANERSPA